VTDPKPTNPSDTGSLEPEPNRTLPSDATDPFDPVVPAPGTPWSSLPTEPPTDPDDPPSPEPDPWDLAAAAPSDPSDPVSDSEPFASPIEPEPVPTPEPTADTPEPPTDPETPAPDQVAPSARSRFRRPTLPGPQGPAGRFGRLGRGRDPRIGIAAVGALVVLFALLASEAGLAIMLAATVIPLALIVTLDRVDVFDREPPLILLGIGTAGAAAGVLIGLLNGFLLDEFWEENAVDRIGVIGLAGELAGRGDSPPVAIYALAGIVVPALAIAAMLAAPVAARRWPAFRNEAMDGVTLGAAAAGGFTLGTALVHLWPLITGDAVAGSVAGWTVAVLSIVLLRPIIIMTIAAVVGLAIWQFDLSRTTRDLVLPLAAGLGGAMLYALLGLLAEQSGATIQLVWSLAIAATLLALGRTSLRTAIDFDKRLLAGNRVVCPNCRRVTPAGKFCAFCQNPLPADVTS